MAPFKLGLRPSWMLLSGLTAFGLAAAASSPSPAPSDCCGEWTTKASMVTPRYESGGAVLDGKLFVAGGYADPDTSTDTVEAYDPATDSWSTKAPLLRPRIVVECAEAGGVLYAVGGFGGGVIMSHLEAYDPSADAWSDREPLPKERYAGQVATLDGKIYVPGGVSDDGAETRVDVYDPATDSWSQVADLPGFRVHAMAAATGGKLYVIGGDDANGSWLNTVVVYDPASDSWSAAASMSTARGYAGIGVINGEIYVVGGYNGSFPVLTTMEIYTPSTNSWRSGPSALTVRSGAASGVIDEVLYMAGGERGLGSPEVAVDALEAFEPDTTAPVITQPANIQVACSVNELVAVSYSASVTDNCDPSPSVVFNPASGSGFPIGTTQVTVTATDECGNSSSTTFNVVRESLTFTGFQSPIGGADATGGSFSNPLKAFKLKSTIPIKFSLSCDGEVVTTGVHTLAVTKYSSETTSDEPIDATPQGGATSGNQFQLTNSTWHFNLDTDGTGMTTGIWLITATMSDGSQHTAWIQIK